MDNFKESFDYLSEGRLATYPDGFTKDQKRILGTVIVLTYSSTLGLLYSSFLHQCDFS